MTEEPKKLDPTKVAIADLGRMSGRTVRKLKKGKGSGWKEVERAVEDVRADGKARPDLIVVLVRESLSPADFFPF